jgi:hypothetical protein
MRDNIPIRISATDLRKVIQYLEAAAKLYSALPWQQSVCRAHMITELTKKLKSKL